MGRDEEVLSSAGLQGGAPLSQLRASAASNICVFVAERTHSSPLKSPFVYDWSPCGALISRSFLEINS